VIAPAGWRQRWRPPAWLVLIVIAACDRGAGGGRPNEATAGDSAAVRAACATWFGAVEAGDVERAMPVLAPDVVFETPSGDSLVGHQGVREALGAFLETYVERITWALEIVALGADSATVRVREETTAWPRAGGEAVRVRGWHTGYLRRADGGWLIVRDISTLDEPPEPAPDAGPSRARDAIILGNIVGFGAIAVLDLWGMASGARQLTSVFAIIHLLFTIAFIGVGRRSMSGQAS
jgi:uncharacterized protein (TIGR02246 family)